MGCCKYASIDFSNFNMNCGLYGKAGITCLESLGKDCSDKIEDNTNRDYLREEDLRINLGLSEPKSISYAELLKLYGTKLIDNTIQSCNHKIGECYVDEDGVSLAELSEPSQFKYIESYFNYCPLCGVELPDISNLEVKE